MNEKSKEGEQTLEELNSAHRSNPKNRNWNPELEPESGNRKLESVTGNRKRPKSNFFVTIYQQKPFCFSSAAGR